MNRYLAAVLRLLVLLHFALPSSRAEARKLNVVVTNSAYHDIAEIIGGDKVAVTHIVDGNQDPHIVRPKPSYAVQLKQADVYVATGMDLELWSPALVDMSGNQNIRSGQKGYVSASAGIKLLEIPTTLSRAEGDVHIYGNPHIHTSPLNCKTIAENISLGLTKNAPEHAQYFEANLERFKAEIDRRTFGSELVKLLGGKTLTGLAQNGRLIPFLQEKRYRGKSLIDSLGGWMKSALPLRGQKMVAYHKNITYFTNLLGVEIVDYLEPKPGIPPSPGHVARVVETMHTQHITVVWVENYFDIAKVRRIAEMVNAVPVIVSLSPGGQPGMRNVFDMFDIWIRELNRGFSDAAKRNT